MKHYFFIFLLLLFHTVIAEEIPLSQLSIEALIHEIQYNHTINRRVAMNQLKVKLRQKNQASRKALLLKLRQTLESERDFTVNRPNIPILTRPIHQSHSMGRP